MDLSSYLTTLRDDLTTTASAGDEATRRSAAVLAAALEPSARLAIMNALADLAAEVTAHLPDHVVEVRLDGRDVRVVVTKTGTTETPPESPPTAEGDAGDVKFGGDMSRMTLRMFDELKSKAERAASSQGVSLNTYVQQAVQQALQGLGAHHRKYQERQQGHREQDQGSGSGSSRVQGWYEG
ncbi:toxin-antitoxin system HicB family antitoxin [Actinokineospora inagensis]|uniref:toxin-antitoxin system HicB family antitoxin n=1 Tax=Actinokineospora inagensis TaxID=103730 RepID=UPI0004054791|nr:toxin-antitoxin system HicB family antitoxin [Actinokineospora inagensis]